MPPKALLVQRRRALDKWDTGLNSLADHVSEYEAISHALHPFCDPSESAVISQSSSGAFSVNSDESGATVEDAFAHLNKRIEDMEAIETRLKRARAALMSLRNQSLVLSPINRLPPEVLSLIFLLGAAEEDNEFENKSIDEDEEDEIEDPKLTFGETVSAVSRRWHSIATNTANLWTRIDFADGPPFERTRLWLERSNTASLDVSMNLARRNGGAEIDEAMAVIKPHISRCSILTINAEFVGEMNKILAGFLVEPLPPLKSLTLVDVNGQGETVVPSRAKDRVHFMFQLSRGLQHVNLEGVSLPYSSPAFENLVTLRLSGHIPENQPGVETFRSILRRSPNLESLELDGSGIRIPDVDDDSLEGLRIEMNSLRVLRLVGVDRRAIKLLLTIIYAPKLRAFSLCSPESPFEDEQDEDEDEELLLLEDELLGEAVRLHLYQTSLPFVTAQDKGSSGSRNHTAGHGAPVTGTGALFPLPPPLHPYATQAEIAQQHQQLMQIGATVDEFVTQRADAIAANNRQINRLAQAAAALSPIRDLNLEDVGFAPESLAMVLSLVPNVESLRLTALLGITDEVLELFTIPIKSPLEPDTGNVEERFGGVTSMLCPDLVVLKLCELDLITGRGVLDMLKRRKEAGHKIRYLKIKNCDVAPELRQEMAQYVDGLEWLDFDSVEDDDDMDLEVQII